MSDFVIRKPVGSFNFVEPELKVVEVQERKPTVNIPVHDFAITETPVVDEKIIANIVRKFLLWNR